MTCVDIFRFGNVVLDVSRGSLRDGGAEVALRSKALDLLLTLARNAGRTMSRDGLFDAVWPAVTVTDDIITQCVREVRRAIGDSEGRVLRTIVKRGYCLDVVGESTAPSGHAPPAQTECDDRPSLVDLPFQGNSRDTEWFADGIVEEITTALSRFRSLFVIARNSAFTFKGSAWMSVMSDGCSASVTFLKGVFATPARSCASMASSSKPQPAATYGPTGSMA